MKSTNLILALAIGAGIVVASCKPKESSSNLDSNVESHNQDVNNTKSESDNLNTDVNNALINISGFGKNGEVQAYSICGAVIDSSHQFDSPNPYITFTFDGQTNCDGRIRSGVVKVKLIQGTAWTDVGAKLEITHTAYKVVYTYHNNHFLVFNGIKYLTNVNGYDPWQVWLGLQTVSIRERATNLTVDYENGQTAHWSVARLSSWSMSNSGYQINATVNGDTVVGGKTLDSWGVTRFGTNFTTEMIQPWKSNTTCGLWRPTSGKYTSVTDSFSITATLGVNTSGNQISSGCAHGLKLDWTLGVHSGNAVIGYW